MAGWGPDEERAHLTAYDPAAYGDGLGSTYDTLYPPDSLETDAAVDLLAELAEEHPHPSVLEFGIGTGRLALGLHRRGIRVAGIEASQGMVDELRRKWPSAPLDVAVGDYMSTRVAGSFSTVALVFNNVLDPRGLPAQLAIFENAARHLVPGGYFVVEAFILHDEDRDGHWTVSPRSARADHVELQMARFDNDTNTLERVLVHLRPEGAEFVSVRDVYAGPAELDVMAHVNGMKRSARFESWLRRPLTARSRRHVTVYKVS